jgi:hypothetical protein
VAGGFQVKRCAFAAICLVLVCYGTVIVLDTLRRSRVLGV